jgi:hypothetical protein
LRRWIALTAIAALAACHGGDPGSAAGTVTRAVYNDDAKAVTAQMDPSLAKQVTRASVGAISDTMHRLGSYKGLSLLAQDPSKSEFTYRAQFSKGTMNLVVRVGNDGKLTAYRVFPS